MKKITVKGIGKIHERPDCITISFSLRAHEMTYEAAMEVATKQIASLRDALVAIGFEPADLKTTDFNVSTDYKSVYIDNKRNTKDVFNGYICEHDLKLSCLRTTEMDMQPDDIDEQDTATFVWEIK